MGLVNNGERLEAAREKLLFIHLHAVYTLMFTPFLFQFWLQSFLLFHRRKKG